MEQTGEKLESLDTHHCFYWKSVKSKQKLVIMYLLDYVWNILWNVRKHTTLLIVTVEDFRCFRKNYYEQCSTLLRFLLQRKPRGARPDDSSTCSTSTIYRTTKYFLCLLTARHSLHLCFSSPLRLRIPTLGVSPFSLFTVHIFVKFVWNYQINVAFPCPFYIQLPYSCSFPVNKTPLLFYWKTQNGLLLDCSRAFKNL